MKIKIVGIQKQDYKLDNGYSFKGLKLHCIDCDTKPEGLIGDVVTNIKISDDSRLSSVPVAVGETYVVYFNQKGGLDFIQKWTENK